MASRTRTPPRHRPSFIPSLLLLASLASGSSLPIAGIDTIFAFGDSYTTTGYDPSLGVKNTATTATTSAGFNWIQYLAASSSAPSAIYNLAALGATTSNAVVYSNGAGDFGTQVDKFLQYFNASTAEVQWDASTTLFAAYFSNDDFYNMNTAHVDFMAVQPLLLTALDLQIQRLYNAGARNMIIPGMPPLDLTPIATVFGSDALRKGVQFYNARLEVYVGLLAQKFPGMNGFYLDANDVLNTVIAAPSQYGIANTLTACHSYSYATNSPTFSDPTCVYPLAQYFWRDYWHPTWTVHDILAKAAINLLAGDSSITPSGSVAVTGSAVRSSASPTSTPLSAALPSSFASFANSVLSSPSVDALPTTSADPDEAPSTTSEDTAASTPAPAPSQTSASQAETSSVPVAAPRASLGVGYSAGSRAVASVGGVVAGLVLHLMLV